MNGNNNKVIGAIVIIALLALAGWLIWAAVDENNEDDLDLDTGNNANIDNQRRQPIVEDEIVDEEIADEAEIGVTAEDILENPDQYIGQEVTIRAEVEEWLNPRAILFDAEGVVADSILVITQDPTYIFEDPDLFGDDVWQVEGTVREFVFATVTDTLDLDLEPDTFTIYEGGPFIEATSIELYAQ